MRDRANGAIWSKVRVRRAYAHRGASQTGSAWEGDPGNVLKGHCEGPFLEERTATSLGGRLDEVQEKGFKSGGFPQVHVLMPDPNAPGHCAKKVPCRLLGVFSNVEMAVPRKSQGGVLAFAETRGRMPCSSPKAAARPESWNSSPESWNSAPTLQRRRTPLLSPACSGKVHLAKPSSGVRPTFQILRPPLQILRKGLFKSSERALPPHRGADLLSACRDSRLVEICPWHLRGAFEKGLWKRLQRRSKGIRLWVVDEKDRRKGSCKTGFRSRFGLDGPTLGPAWDDVDDAIRTMRRQSAGPL